MAYGETILPPSQPWANEWNTHGAQIQAQSLSAFAMLQGAALENISPGVTSSSHCSTVSPPGSGAMGKMGLSFWPLPDGWTVWTEITALLLLKSS